MEALHAGRRERLRQRLEAEGIMDFQEHEVLEFLLYYMTKPEHQLKVREEIYLDSMLDLF